MIRAVTHGHLDSLLDPASVAIIGASEDLGKFGGRALVGTYLRVGLQERQSWRTFKLRQDFAAAAKIQTEDDISASVVVPVAALTNLPTNEFESVTSVKFVEIGRHTS